MIPFNFITVHNTNFDIFDHKQLLLTHYHLFSEKNSRKYDIESRLTTLATPTI